MTAERWRQVKGIFDAAVECEPDGRAELLRQSCGADEELRREVESLLASDRDSGSFFEHPVLEAVAAAAAPSHSGPSRSGVTSAPRLLKDRYEIDRELGRGGMSVVYLARDRQLLAKQVVVKVLLEETSADPWIRQKFFQEMEALSRIDHPGVVGVLDTGVTPDGKQFLVMQYIEGATLRSLIQQGGFDRGRASSLIRQIGQALAAAHDKGVWHRDLKPENIMVQSLGGEDHVKLIDFGIAGIQNSQFAGEKTKVAGSFAYMAPEQFAGNACAASDTYALGVVAYEILTGKLPAGAGGSRIQLPEPVDRIIQRALSLEPGMRPASVREFSDRLHQALAGTGAGRKTAPPGTVEMGHVLFAGLADYSLLPADRQKDSLEELRAIVHASPRFLEAGTADEVTELPSGGGLALAFFGDPTAAAQCALQLAGAVNGRSNLKLRIGIHSGPLSRGDAASGNGRVTGAVLDTARQVMECGDAGHILVSESVAGVLRQFSQWPAYLTNLGDCTLKDGAKVHLCRLATPELGNSEVPRSLAVAGKRAWKVSRSAAAALIVLAIVCAGVVWLAVRGRAHSAAGRDISSIAVLPFIDLSPEKDQAYFSEGLAEELLNALAKVPGLRVAARTSSFGFSGKSADPREIGKKLNVAAILEGSVRKQGKQARISAQLIQTSDGFNLWSDSYARDLDDIFAVQEEIARAVAGALKIKLLGPKAAPPGAHATNADAYTNYLQGRYFLQRHNGKENLAKAAAYFEQAIQLDPTYAPAWVGLGESRNGQASAGLYNPQEEGFRRAREAVDRALVQDPNLGEAYSALGWIQMMNDADWAGADASYKKALELEPGNAIVISHAAILARILGRLDEATALGRRAMQIDPLSSGAHHNAGVSLYYAGHYEEAQAAFHKALELVPEMAIAHFVLGNVYLAQQDSRQALAEMQKEKRPELRLAGLAMAYHALGRTKESNASLEELLNKFGGPPYQIAEVYAYRGEKDKAFDWLEKAYEMKGLAQIKGDPLLRSLQGDPRHGALLAKMRLPVQ